MRVLVLGAGAIGGYYGGRLAAAGADVTFLVRDSRAKLLGANGLVVRSELGDIAMPVQTVLSSALRPGFDAILISCKSYDLDSAIDAIRPAAPGAMMVPLLNGIRHLELLDSAFGQEHVAGGVAAVSVTQEADGSLRHFGKERLHVHGARHPSHAEQCVALAELLSRAGFNAVNHSDIMQMMWDKFVLFSTTCGVCCMMRAGPGLIARTTHGAAVAATMLDECTPVAAAAGYPTGEQWRQLYSRRFSRDVPPPNPPSMLRDMERGGPIEADHIVGDMLRRAEGLGHDAPLLRAAFAALQTYELQRGPGAH